MIARVQDRTELEHSGLIGRLIDWWRKGPPGHELDRMDAFEVDRIAADLGLATSELRRLSNRDPEARLMLHRRLEQLGLTLDEIEKAGLRRDLERTCGLCPDQATCEHDFDMRPESDDWKSYCTNRGTLEAYLAKKKQ